MHPTPDFSIPMSTNINQKPHISRYLIVAILDIGAYQEISTCNFNAMPRPSTLLVRGKDAEIIKRAETQEEVFSRDIIPDRLK
jgi:diaminopimelate decarboxylase